jgi:hypothetical protein
VEHSQDVLIQRRARACYRRIEVGEEIPPARHDRADTARVGAKLALVQVQQLVRRLIGDCLASVPSAVIVTPSCVLP